MASIVLIYKPIIADSTVTVAGIEIPGTGAVAYHGFLLLQDDNGQYTDIARGGPESALTGAWIANPSDGTMSMLVSEL